MISKKNYEIWFLDYLEDNLSTEETDRLLIFLKENPLLKIELDTMSLYHLEFDNTITFSQKDDIHKPYSDISDIDEMMIADMEGDISLKEKLLLDKYINNNDFEENSNYYNLSRVESDKSLEYNEKSNLRKTNYSLDDIDTLLLSYLDNTISEHEKNWLITHFSPEALERQLSIFRKTKLETDLSIVYSDKKQLKQEVARVIPIAWVRRAVGIAASLLFLYFGYRQINQDTTHIDNDRSITKVSKATPKTDIKYIKSNNENSLADNISSDKEILLKTHIKADNNILTELNVDTKLKNSGHSNFIEQKVKSNNQIVYASEREILSTHLESNIVSPSKYRPSLRISPIKAIYPNQQLASIVMIPRVSIDRDISNITSVILNRDIVELEKLPNSLLDKAIASLDKNENETGRRLNLGIFEIEVPEILIASVESIQESQRINQQSKRNKRKVFSFSLGNFSVYHSSK